MTPDQFKNLLAEGWPMDTPRLVIPWKSSWEQLVNMPGVQARHWQRWKNGRQHHYAEIVLKGVRIECLPAIIACTIGPIEANTDNVVFTRIECFADSLENLAGQLTTLFGEPTVDSGSIEDKGGAVSSERKIWIFNGSRVTTFSLDQSLKVEVV